MAWRYVFLVYNPLFNEKEIHGTKDERIPEIKRAIEVILESKSTLAVSFLEGDEKKLFQNIVDNDGILQRNSLLRQVFRAEGKQAS